MVAHIKTYSTLKALTYLSLLAILACSNETPKTVVKLYFKQPDAVISALKANFEQDIDFHIVDNNIVFHAPKNEIKKTLSLLKVLDQPPSIYTLHLQPSKDRSYSTSKKPRYLDLIEGKTTTLSLNNLRHEFNISRISEQRSILNIKISKRTKEPSEEQLFLNQSKRQTIAEHHIVLTHNRWGEIEELELSRQIIIKLSE